ncbi:hypothetical protein ABIC09_002196 [Bradyrhizobium sp. S3.12.5]
MAGGIRLRADRGPSGQREEPATRGTPIGCCMGSGDRAASPLFSRLLRLLRGGAKKRGRARRRTHGACCSKAAVSARFLLELIQPSRRRITWALSNLWPSPRTYQSWGFQRPMPNGRRRAMIFRLRGVALLRAQPEAYQPTGNGISGQTRQLSLAALADFSWGGLAIGVGGDKTIVRCKCANCKFMIIDLRSQSFEKMELENQPDARFGNGARILKSRMHLRKDRQAFQPARRRSAGK